MATRAAQIGFAAETTYGVRVVPTRFLEFNSESLKFNITRIESSGLRAGTRVQRSAFWAAGSKGAEGDIEFEVVNKGFGLIFKHMLGAVAISTPGGGTATRDHTHTLADPTNQSLTIQVGRPDTVNTSRPFDYLGCKLNGWELSNSVDEFLMLTVNVDGNDEKLDQSLASASYATGTKPFSFAGATVTVGGSSFEASDITLTGNANLKTDRYFLRADTKKKEPLANAYYEVSGAMSAEYVDNTAYNRFVNGTEAAVVAKWEGDTIEGSFKNHVEVTLPACRFDGETPVVSGSEMLVQPLNFKVMDNGAAEPITLVYRTTDTVS